MKNDLHDFYMFYRMRTKQTFSVKSTVGMEMPYYVKVIIEDDKKSFKKVLILGVHGETASRAIDIVMKKLIGPEEDYFSSATQENLDVWDKL